MTYRKFGLLPASAELLQMSECLGFIDQVAKVPVASVCSRTFAVASAYAGSGAKCGTSQLDIGADFLQDGGVLANTGNSDEQIHHLPVGLDTLTGALSHAIKCFRLFHGTLQRIFENLPVGRAETVVPR